MDSDPRIISLYFVQVPMASLLSIHPLSVHRANSSYGSDSDITAHTTSDILQWQSLSAMSAVLQFGRQQVAHSQPNRKAKGKGKRRKKEQPMERNEERERRSKRSDIHRLGVEGTMELIPSAAKRTTKGLFSERAENTKYRMPCFHRKNSVIENGCIAAPNCSVGEKTRIEKVTVWPSTHCHSLSVLVGREPDSGWPPINENASGKQTISEHR